ncbi:permease-like cell division protein FtsX [Vallitalea guaymasensis]|uniref:Cell division protein FtsX n=1 Tax=Vallitalea guaymasensis TaxID=1185412 RepID=A0A8J8MC36_9FIRM|nr:permease-like cell division protein FtsX [Vallitalea guaymasensis]QUH30153.1 ABC transporter permease [Vallitalea guaymasensis]
MKLRTVDYCFKQGVINLFKNRLMSIASIGTIAACLFIVGIFYITAANIEYTLKEAESNLGIAVFLKENITETDREAIETMISQREEVKSVEYISPEQAWEDFKKTMYENNEDLLVGFDGENNPLKNSDSFQVLIKDINNQESLIKYIQTLEGVREINQEKNLTEIIKGFNNFINYMSIVLIVILIFISVFLISNTVRIAISVRKNEIGIMKYLGAKDFFIKFPFIIEGMLIGAIGAIVPLTVIYFSYDYVINKINDKFIVINQFLSFLNVGQIYRILIPLSLIIGIGIGIVGSRITIRKHLRV